MPREHDSTPFREFALHHLTIPPHKNQDFFAVAQFISLAGPDGRSRTGAAVKNGPILELHHVFESPMVGAVAGVQTFHQQVTHHGLTDRTPEWRQEMVRFSAPLRHDTNDDIVSFKATNGDRQAIGIHPDGYKSQGKLKAGLQQVKWSKRRTEPYQRVHDDFVVETRRRFGDSISFQEVDHLLP